MVTVLEVSSKEGKEILAKNTDQALKDGAFGLPVSTLISFPDVGFHARSSFFPYVSHNFLRPICKRVTTPRYRNKAHASSHIIMCLVSLFLTSYWS